MINATSISRLTPHRQGIPGTPVHVLRSRNLDLTQKIIEKDDLLKKSDKEFLELREFQRNEINFLEESFKEKMADGPVDLSKVAEKQREIDHLKLSLSDFEALLLDANHHLSEKCQEISSLQEQVTELVEKSSKFDRIEREFSTLQSKHVALQKIMNEKEEKTNRLENERKDFDMTMELALEKQRVKERDLRRSLE
ncbi:hypothetical protein SK128_027076, partial [Halocaridina rubra]